VGLCFFLIQRYFDVVKTFDCFNPRRQFFIKAYIALPVNYCPTTQWRTKFSSGKEKIFGDPKKMEPGQILLGPDRRALGHCPDFGIQFNIFRIKKMGFYPNYLG